jgi:hypothetical protein
MFAAQFEGRIKPLRVWRRYAAVLSARQKIALNLKDKIVVT